MSRKFSRSFYNSKAWIDTRNYIKQKQLGLCAECGEVGDEVHHIIPLSPKNINNINITLGEDNLVLLCKHCHDKKHKNVEAIRDGLMFNERGELVLKE